MRFLQWRAAHFKGTSFLFHETCCQDRRLMLEDKSPDDRPQFLGGGLLSQFPDARNPSRNERVVGSVKFVLTKARV